ncbi:hypothetical protein MGAST_19480 [Mycobacterium gastri 'Wayne']|uniref:Uncharacterized protein n=1 Tax=Mycobacterium gastri TaxID=1777 RepID=A0A1X1VVQ7_MYCGS|nr:hypothetical protein MGAST_19480 [Mycobacterium gastri 'Wayne']ORV73204.1 hypothetical protein AWC07_02855 [Mycobacterium gastri]
MRTATVDSRSASRSGRSTIENVRAASISSNRAFGMVAASRSPSSRAKNLSSADQAISAGLSTSRPASWLRYRCDRWQQ